MLPPFIFHSPGIFFGSGKLEEFDKPALPTFG
jgi:hypothetical protein